MELSDVGQDIADYFLFPSALFADRVPHGVQTILGSCIAVCLHDVKLGFGGINHYMMPWWKGEGIPSPKYGDVSIELLVRKMELLGSNRSNLIAKIFGGANQHFQNSTLDIGGRNIETALTSLDDFGIPIIGKSVGGAHGRKIFFHTGTGQVFMKTLDRPEIKNYDEAIKSVNC